MALLLRIANATAKTTLIRAVSTQSSAGTVQKSVFISQSNDAAANLALEDWMHANMDFSQHHVMLVHKNDPCVLLGRHQNPWLEANVPASWALKSADEADSVEEAVVPLIRRPGSGGTTYLDQGAVTVTFFTGRAQYKQKYNLDLVTRGIFREYGLKLNLSASDEHTAHNMKISTNSTRIGNEAASFSCFLYVDSKKDDISNALQKHETDIETNAIKSPKSNYLNLNEINPRITVDGLIKSVGNEFLRTIGTSVKDGGKQQASLQRGFQLINPTENWFPGLDDITARLTSWRWNYGATPPFTVSRTFTAPANFWPAAVVATTTGDDATQIRVSVTVCDGRVGDVRLAPAASHSDRQDSIAATGVITSLRGERFSAEALNKLEDRLSGGDGDVDGESVERERFVTDCVRQVMRSI